MGSLAGPRHGQMDDQDMVCDERKSLAWGSWCGGLGTCFLLLGQSKVKALEVRPTKPPASFSSPRLRKSRGTSLVV